MSIPLAFAPMAVETVPRVRALTYYFPWAGFYLIRPLRPATYVRPPSCLRSHVTVSIKRSSGMLVAKSHTLPPGPTLLPSNPRDKGNDPVMERCLSADPMYLLKRDHIRWGISMEPEYAPYPLVRRRNSESRSGIRTIYFW